MSASIHAVLDAGAASQQAIDACRESINEHGEGRVAVLAASPDLAGAVFTESDVDIFVVTAPTHRWTAQTLPLIERAFADHPDLGMLYGPQDDDHPDWSIDRLRTEDYLGGILAIRGNVARRLGGIRTEFYPYHRWDLALRACEAESVVACAARPLAVRVEGDSRLTNPECVRRGRQVLAEHLERSGISALAEALAADDRFRRRPVATINPSVSIVIPSQVGQHLTLPAQLARLEQVLTALRRRTDYPHYEVLAVTQSSIPERSVERLGHSGGPRARVLPVCRDGAMRWRHLEEAARRVTGDVIVVIDDDAIAESSDWLSIMAPLALEPGVGAVSATFTDHLRSRDTAMEPLATVTTTLVPGCLAIRRELFVRMTGLLDDTSGTTMPALLRGRGLTCLTANYASFRRWAERAHPRAEQSTSGRNHLAEPSSRNHDMRMTTTN